MASGWIGPLRFPRSVGRGALRVAAVGQKGGAGARLMPAALIAGSLPLAVAFAVGGSWHQPLSAFLLFLLFLGCVRADEPARALVAVGLAFAAHMALAILLTAHAPRRAAAILPGSEEYWKKQEHWIRTGEDPEYDLMRWVPAHLQTLVVIPALSYVSLGFIPFLEGFHQVDLMDHYVGRLATGSSSTPVALVFGWHLWSLMRGLCYAVLVYELASWSLSRLASIPLSTLRGRRLRWGIGLSFFLMDCMLKLTLLEPVRQRLQENLIAS